MRKLLIIEILLICVICFGLSFSNRDIATDDVIIITESDETTRHKMKWSDIEIFIEKNIDTIEEEISFSDDVTMDSTLTVGDFTQYTTIYASSAQVGVTAPAATTVETFRGLLFNAAAELVFIEFEVSEDWNGTSDMTLKIYGFAESADSLADGEVLEFDAQYRSIADGEPYDNGTAVTITPNYTQSGAGTDKARIELEATIDYDNTDQPLTKGDTVGFVINRDVTTDDTYSGDFNVFKFEIVYTANTFPIHQQEMI